jgi:exopolyphosphatase/pppGpp-phosphohydrolase
VPSRSKISASVQVQVRQRAGYLCEYCHAAEQWQYVQFTVDHVVPLSLNGVDHLENLALACFHCNRRKTNRLTAIDPQSNEETPLFNPRQQVWCKHFIWSTDGLLILALTPVGHATIATLALNRERVINIRAADKEIGRHPPTGDPIQSGVDESS